VETAREISGAEHATQPGFPGWGEAYAYCSPAPVPAPRPRETRLGELASTAICGNDITSSCFYVTGAMAAAAGIWAPFGAIFAAMTLWLFRWVYTEAVTALPFNGGIYNILLNTLDSKRVAALAATLTMLSYMATAVVSALSAGSYLQSIIDDSKQDPMEEGNHTIPVAISLIVCFCLLKLCGISESANVAACMFTFHLATMAVLMTVGFVAIVRPRGILPFEMVVENLQANFKFTGGGSRLSQRVVLGFSNAMLGVSGFESSANFVEEQRPGVFPKTLRNMWYSVSILNITFIFECIFATRLSELTIEKDMSLAFLAKKVGGRWLELLVSIDAVVVLAASILTSYVGFGGLTSRMSGDRCLPALFNRNDKLATIIFMCVSVSWVIILEGDSSHLAACYSFAFLTVMALFALGLIALQTQRPKLPRDMKNNLYIPTVAFMLVMVALISALISNLDVIPFLLFYLALLSTLLILFLYRLKLLGVVETMLSRPDCFLFTGCLKRVRHWKDSISRESSVVYFSKTANICRLNQSIQYVLSNEDANRCRVVHVYDDEVQIPRNLVQYCQLLDAIYPKIRVDVAFVKATFGAPLIDFLSTEWGVAPNLMFITCPASVEAGKRIEDLRGVRVIMGHEEESLAENAPAGACGYLDGELEKAMSGERPVSLLVSYGIAQECFWTGGPACEDMAWDVELPAANGWCCSWRRRPAVHDGSSDSSALTESDASDGSAAP